MKVLPLAFLFCLPLLTAPALGQQKQRKLALPSAMIGVWGEKPESCEANPTERDDRIEIEQSGVGTFVSIYGVRNWQRKGKVYSGSATVSEEGESKPMPGKYPVALTLQDDGRLKVQLDKGAAAIYVKCPPGTNPSYS